jgi:hypothetical protein
MKCQHKMEQARSEQARRDLAAEDVSNPIPALFKEWDVAGAWGADLARAIAGEGFGIKLSR